MSRSVENQRERERRPIVLASDKLVLCVLGIHELGLDMAKVVSLLFIGVKDLVLVAHKLDGLLVFILLDSLCECGVEDLAAVGRDAKVVKAVQNLGWSGRSCGFVVRVTAAVFGAASVFVGVGEHVLLASDLCFAGNIDGAEKTALLGVTVGLAASYVSVCLSWSLC